MQGQINLDSAPGQMIRYYASRDDVSTVFEIGTWNGKGSTVCVIEGLKDKEDYSFITLEADPGMHRIAVDNKSEIEGVEYVYGTLVRPDEFYTVDLNHEEQSWIVDDIARCMTAPLVNDKVPDSIDFLILDGSEFATRAEFLKLRDRSKHIFLDDTSIRKNKLNRQELLDDPRFEVIEDHPSDRNGWALFSRK